MSVGEAERKAKYLRRNDIYRRFGITRMTLHRLRHHEDPELRFPEPTMVLMNSPLWSIEAVAQYEQRQIALSKDRKTVGPKF